MEQNIRKQIDCKRPLNTKQMKEYKIFELKYGNKKLSNVLKYNQVKLVLAVFASNNLYQVSIFDDNELKQIVIGKHVKFTHIAKPAISNTENFIKGINSESTTTKYVTIKGLNSTFNDIGSSFSLFHLNINSLSFFDELESLISKSKNDFQIIGI